MVSQKIDLATPLSNANSSIVSITYNIGQPVIGKSSNGMIKKGFLYLVRSSTPTVTLTDTDNNNIVTGSNVVTITAAFSESMIATPTINITGEVTNVAMTASSTASVWIYPWTVSTTTSGIVSATVAGIDVYGKVYAGTTSITFTISQTIYFENNTCKCPNATVGDSTTISGTTYIAVNNSTIAGQIAAGNYNLCTTLVTHMSSLFAGNSSFNSNIGFWDTSNVTTMGDLFQSADNFNQDISGWDVSNVTNMNNMFKYARSFNQNIGSWDVSSVTTMSVMFTEADDFNQDISGWNVTNVSDMYAMFNSADDFNQDISGWNVTNVSNMNAMFNSANDFNQDLTGWCVSNISSEPSDFSTSSALTNSNKPIWDTCAPLVTLTDTDANNIVTGSNVVTITATFSEAMAVTPTINITGEVSNVAMTASSTASVWIYPWTVSTTTSGIVSATVAGTDLSGNAYAGTTSITFTIDNTIPQVSSPSVSSDNLTVSITFSEQVFTEIINATGSNTLTVSDFELSLSGNSSLTLSSSTPTSISVSGNSYELKIPFNGFANGTESLTITIPNNSIFDIAGNTFSSSQTIGLNNNLLIYYDFSNPNSYNGQTTTSSNASVTDLSGNNNDGFVRGIAEVYYDQFEDAFYFNGSQTRDGKGIAISNLNYVSGDADQINEMTIIARVKSKSQSSGATNDERIIFSFDRSSNFRFGIGADVINGSSGKLAFTFTNSDGTNDTYAVSQTINLRDDLWHDVAVTFKANQAGGLKYYIDGDLVYTHPNSFNPISNHSDNETPRYGYVGNGSDASTFKGATNPDDLFYGHIQAIKYYSKSLPINQLTGIDTSPPNVSLTDTDSDNIVSDTDTVLITATFSEAMTSTPTVSISGQITNASMSVSTTSSIWSYPWVVPKTFNGQAFATVSGNDVSGNAYAGTTSITFKDGIPPEISATAIEAQNNYVDILFDQPIYGNNSASSGLTSSSLSAIQTSGVNFTINFVGLKKNDATTFSAASALTGGETTIRAFMDFTNISPSGGEVYKVTATNSATVFDINGNGMLVNQTSNTFTLFAPISGPISIEKSTIAAAPNPLIPDGVIPILFTVQAKDSLGQNFTKGGAQIKIFSDAINITITDNVDGTYSGSYIPERLNQASKSILFNFSVNDVTATRSVTVLLNGDQDGDGVADLLDECPGTDSSFKVDEKGCALNQIDT